MAVEYEEFCESERACAESRTLNGLDTQLAGFHLPFHSYGEIILLELS